MQDEKDSSDERIKQYNIQNNDLQVKVERLTEEKEALDEKLKQTEARYAAERAAAEKEHGLQITKLN